MINEQGSAHAYHYSLKTDSKTLYLFLYQQHNTKRIKNQKKLLIIPFKGLSMLMQDAQPQIVITGNLYHQEKIVIIIPIVITITIFAYAYLYKLLYHCKYKPLHNTQKEY